MTEPSKMPKHRPARPVQGRHSDVARKWRRHGNNQTWEDEK